jgi:ribosomal protein S18 acetylase RimI-like enzyme
LEADSVTLRPAEETDLPSLVTLLRRSWLTTWAPELPFEAVQVFAAVDPARTYAEEMWRAFLVAVSRGRIVGVVHILGDTVESLDVDPKAKRRGIGSLLMEEAECRIALLHSSARLEVRAFNSGAFAFYKQRGWIENRRYMASECSSPVETIEMVKPVENKRRSGIPA